MNRPRSRVTRLTSVVLCAPFLACLGPYFEPARVQVTSQEAPAHYREVVVGSVTRVPIQGGAEDVSATVADRFRAKGIPARVDTSLTTPGPDQLLLSGSVSPARLYFGPSYFWNIIPQALTVFTYGFIYPQLYPTATGIVFALDFKAEAVDRTPITCCTEPLVGFHRTFFWWSEHRNAHHEEESRSAVLVVADELAEEMRALLPAAPSAPVPARSPSE